MNLTMSIILSGLVVLGALPAHGGRLLGRADGTAGRRAGLHGISVRQDLAYLTRQSRVATAPEFMRAALYVVNRFHQLGLQPLEAMPTRLTGHRPIGGRGAKSYLHPFHFWPNRGGANPSKLRGYNTVGVLPGDGSTPGHVLVTAHLDTVPGTPGAHDNASGVAGLLLLAQTLARYQGMGHKLKQDVVFVATGAEELGMKGMFAARSLVANETAHVNFDMIGRGDRRAVPFFGGHNAEEASRNPAYLKGLAIRPKGDMARPAPGHEWNGALFSCSDQKISAERGKPSVFYSGEMVDYHKPTDTPDKVDENRIRGVVRHAARLVIDLAGRADPPP